MYSIFTILFRNGSVSFTIFNQIRIASIGHNFNESPLSGLRKNIVGFSYLMSAKIILIACGITVTREVKDIDYSYYLGPDYKKTQ